MEVLFSGDLPSRPRLYHYTRPEKLFKILESDELRLSPFSEMRDPRERSEWRPSLSVDDGSNVTPSEFWAWQEELDAGLRSGVKITSFSEDREPEGVAGSAWEFHRGYARARMWEQYAADHTGACLIFDKERLLTAARAALAGYGQLTDGPVRYADVPVGAEYGLFTFKVSEIRREGTAGAARRYLRDHLAELFFTKNLDWRSEEEYRLALVDENPASGARQFSFERALDAVVVGESFSDVDRLKSLLDTTRTSVRSVRCIWFGGSPRVVPL